MPFVCLFVCFGPNDKQYDYEDFIGFWNAVENSVRHIIVTIKSGGKCWWPFWRHTHINRNSLEHTHTHTLFRWELFATVVDCAKFHIENDLFRTNFKVIYGYSMQTDFNIGQMQSLPVDHHQLFPPRLRFSLSGSRCVGQNFCNKTHFLGYHWKVYSVNVFWNMIWFGC